MLPALGSQSPPVVYDDALYMALPDGLLTGLHKIKPDHRGNSPKCVMMVGHNPGFEELALLLAGDGPADKLARLSEKFPTAAAAVIAFDAEELAGPQAGDWTAQPLPHAQGATLTLMAPLPTPLHTICAPGS